MVMGFENIKEGGSDEIPHVLKVVGIGGGGGNAVNRMISTGITSVEFIVANTDLQDLKTSLAPHKIQMGGRSTRGLGAGAKPNTGKEAALEDVEAIKEHLAGADMVFITAGMGGGTGTGAAPVIAELAREIGALTVAVVTKPFKFEGKVRQRNGEEGIIELRRHVDTLIVIPNDNLLLLANKNTPIVDAFIMADDVLRIAIQGISELMNNNGLINLDFADVKAIMSNMGQAIMGTGSATGDNRAIEAAEKAIHSPLLDDCRIDGAKGILINVTGPPTMKLFEINEAANYITGHADEDANIIFGAATDDSLPEDTIEVTVIATGFNGVPIQPAPSLRGNRELMPRRSNFKVYNSSGRESFAGEEEEAPDFTQGSLNAHASHRRDEEPQELEDDELPGYQGGSFLGLSSREDDLESEEEREEDVYELKNPELEPIETRPQIPDSYRPEEQPPAKSRALDSNLDIPTFIRDRSRRLSED